MNILKISFQYSTCTGKETPFRSEIDKTTSSKQTRSSYERKEIKTLVIFQTLFAQVSADSIRTHACSRIKYIVFYYSEQLIANVTPCFLQAVQFSFGLLCMVQGFARSKKLILVSTTLRSRCLIWKRKRHTFATFRQVNNKSFLKGSKRLFGFKSFKSKQCENKLTSRQRKLSL